MTQIVPRTIVTPWRNVKVTLLPTDGDGTMRLVSSIALFACLICADCDGLYQNTKNPSSGWIKLRERLVR